MANKIVLSRGPLSYNYTLDHIVIHYATDVHRGSEHLIDGNSFPVEIQFYLFNSQLYSSWKDAESKPNGIASLALLALIANGDTASKTNLQFKLIAEAVKASSLKGGKFGGLRLAHLLFRGGRKIIFTVYSLHFIYTFCLLCPLTRLCSVLELAFDGKRLIQSRAFDCTQVN